MKIENCIKKNADTMPYKNIAICLRITKPTSLWLKENKLSPTAIFNEAVKELGYKGN